MKKSPFLIFCFSFIPGAGAMYLGYMKRGLGLITLFCLSIMATAVIPLCGFAIPVIWMYSFFDTYNLRTQLWNGTAPADGFPLLDGTLRGVNLKSNALGKILGGGLILAGSWLILETVIYPILMKVAQRYDLFFLYNLMDNLWRVVVSVLLIWLGVRLAFGGRKKKQIPPPDFTEFKGDHANDQN